MVKPRFKIGPVKFKNGLHGFIYEVSEQDISVRLNECLVNFIRVKTDGTFLPWNQDFDLEPNAEEGHVEDILVKEVFSNTLSFVVDSWFGSEDSVKFLSDGIEPKSEQLEGNARILINRCVELMKMKNMVPLLKLEKRFLNGDLGKMK